MTPEIWQECGKCKGYGYVDNCALTQEEHRTAPENPCDECRDMDKCTVGDFNPCPHCSHSPKPGYRAILYTPEQWEEAGGVLHDDLRVWFKDHYLAKWVNDSYKSAMTWKNPLYFQIIVSTTAITMKDLEEI